MKRYMLVVLIFCTALTAGAQGVREEAEAPDLRTVSIAALQGPTGFGLARVLDAGAVESEIIEFDSRVLPAPAEAVSRLASGELDAALLPVNLASVVYNRGLEVTAAAVTGEGMIHLLSRDHAIETWGDLEGKTVHVAARGATPDYLTQFILEEQGLAGSVDLDYSVTSPPQLAQLLIAGQVTSIVVPEPFATMADMQGGDDIRRVLDYQEAWKEIFTTDSVYPMTLLVISNELIEQDPAHAEAVMAEIKGSIAWTLEHPREAAQVIEEFGILAAPMAEPAIPHSALTFLPVDESRQAVEDFLQVLFGFDPSSIGGALPDDRFYYR